MSDSHLWTGSERRNGRHRPMSASTVVAVIGLFLGLAGSWTYAVRYTSQYEAKTDSRFDAVETSVEQARSALARHNAILEGLDALVQRLATTEQQVAEQKEQTKVLQEVRTALAVAVAQLSALQGDVRDIKREMAQDRRSGRPAGPP